MSVDIYTSRRHNFDKVWYWKRNDAIKDLSKYVYETQPDGFFYAREMSPAATDNAQVQNVYLYDKSNISLATEDKVNLEVNDIVKYADEIWRVNNVQRAIIGKTHQFMKRVAYRTYIQVTK